MDKLVTCLCYDRAAAARAMTAMMGMAKIDIAALERAFAGGAV